LKDDLTQGGAPGKHGHDSLNEEATAAGSNPTRTENGQSGGEDSDLAELLCDVPPPVRTLVMGMIRTSIGRAPFNPLSEKLTPDHIDKVLDNLRREDENLHSYRSSNRWFYVLFALIFLGFIAYLLPLNEKFVSDFIKIAVGFAGGLGAGYGLKARR